MAELPNNFSELHAASEQDRIDFLQTDLALCFTFADLVITELEMGDRDAAGRILQKAETGCVTIAQFLARVEDGGQKQAIAQKLGELRARLDGLRDQFPLL